MRTTLQIFALVLLVAGTSINFNTVFAQNKTSVSIEQNGAKITGVITFPKTMVIPANFATAVKTNMKAYKYELQNGQLTNPQLLDGLNITLADISAANTNYYSMAYTISGNLPYNKPIIVNIGNFNLQSPTGFGDNCYMFSLNCKNPIALLSTENAVVEQYNFSTISAFLRYDAPYNTLKFIEQKQLAETKSALVY